MSDERFQSLHGVKTRKPAIPDEDEDEEHRVVPWPQTRRSSHTSSRHSRHSRDAGTASAPAIGNRRTSLRNSIRGKRYVFMRGRSDSKSPNVNGALTISNTFHSLVEALVAQHAMELQELQARVEVQAAQMSQFTDNQTTDHSMEELKSAGSEVSQLSVASHGSQTTGRLIHATSAATVGGSPTVSAVFLNKHKNMREMQASEIINMFDKSEASEARSEAQSGMMPDIFEADESMDMVHADSDLSNRRVNYAKLTRFERLQAFLTSNTFEMLITGFLLVNVLWMGMELQINGQMNGHTIGFYMTPMLEPASWLAFENFISAGDIIFSALFALDVTIRLLVLGGKFFKVCMNYVDLGVTVASLAEIFIFATTPVNFVNPVLFRLLRIGKLARALRMVTMSNVLASLQLLLKCLAASMDMLFWTFCLLTFLQCVAGMIVSTLCRDFIIDETKDLDLRLEVFKYYGTFTRTFLSMFEILFANWAPPCRAVVEAISEWFSVFFLLYRCVLGFAVLNVVNAVFVQQTMKTASSDEDLAFKQKQKDAAVYIRKVKKLFSTMDASGDGAINLEEFAKLVQSPKLKFWMSQLELEYHDLLSLFEFLDNGDGQITLSEFIEGAGRLRGSAKALDIWRLETKVEVLFEEIINRLRPTKTDVAGMGVRGTLSVQDIFEHSSFRHIQATTRGRGEKERDSVNGSGSPGDLDAVLRTQPRV